MPPTWALFQRLNPCAADRAAREEAERAIEKEFESVMDEGHGVQSFKATLDLTTESSKKIDS